MSIYIFFPPLKTGSGGLRVLKDLVQILTKNGYEVKTSSDPNFFQTKLTSQDVYLVPEGWFNALLPGLKAKAKIILYCQNWAYLFTGVPPDIDLVALPLTFWAVSYPVAWFMEQTLGVKAKILRPSLDFKLFYPPEQKSLFPVKIAYMPRKNKGLTRQILQTFLALTKPKKLADKIKFLPIENLKPGQVGEVLRQAHIFLSTGFPEGLGLPPLEAMACNCLVVGFTGFGGWDYARPFNSHLVAPFDLPSLPWQKNGLFTSDGDVLNTALSLIEAVSWYLNQDERFFKILEQGQKTAQFYTAKNQKKTLLDLISRVGIGN